MLSLKKNGAEKLVSFISKYFVNDLYGRKLGLYNESEYFKGEFIHRTVISPTMLESNKDGFEVKLNLRTSYGTTREDLVRAFDKTGCKYLFYQYMDPIYVDGDSEFLRVLKNNYSDITGLDGEFTLAYGTSYAKAMMNIVAWGPIFPGETDYCHEANERISIESLMKAARIYSSAIADIALSAKSFKQ
jgi:succinyl-diaminopimelate desuccinylase